MAEDTEEVETPQGESGDTQKTYTQDEVNEFVQKRVSREKAKYKDYKQYKADSEELAKLKEANKSEIEKANDRAAKAEAERDALLAEKNVAAWKAEVAEDTGIPADALEGSTKEEIEAHAERLKPYFAKDAAPQVRSEGHRPNERAVESNASKFARSIEGLI